MALSDLTDQAAVNAAIDEFDALGRDEFLARYGFKPARDYFVVQDGKQCDSKAIAGAAHGHQHGEPLTAAMFSGGDSMVAAKLERLGFEVTRPPKRQDWTSDELMLALDLYLRLDGKFPTRTPRRSRSSAPSSEAFGCFPMRSALTRSSGTRRA